MHYTFNIIVLYMCKHMKKKIIFDIYAFVQINCQLIWYGKQIQNKMNIYIYIYTHKYMIYKFVYVLHLIKFQNKKLQNFKIKK